MRKVFEGFVFGLTFNLVMEGFKLHATCIKSGGTTKVMIIIIILLGGGVFSVYMYIYEYIPINHYHFHPHHPSVINYNHLPLFSNPTIKSEIFNPQHLAFV